MYREAQSKSTRGREWTVPERIKVDDEQSKLELEQLQNSPLVYRINDAPDEIANDLYELHYPDKSQDSEARNAFISERLAEHEAFGTWMYFPWDGQLTRYPDEEDHQSLRTYRNRNLITESEQNELLQKHIAVIGLSVGSNAALSLTQGGVGGEYTLADFDTIAPTNLNRLQATMADVGTSKIDFVAQRISEIDPYLTQRHLRDGYDSYAEDILDAHRPDIMIEEADELSAKIRAREFARERAIPLLMATDIGKKTVIDIEDYRDAKTVPFNGRLSSKLYDKVLNDAASEKEQKKAKAQMAGLKHLSPRLIDSFLEIDSTLAGLPQLGSVATMGGVALTVAAREILLGRPVKSGEYAIQPEKLMKFRREAGPIATARAFGSLIRNMK